MSSRNLPKWLEIWNRKFHIYIGLYLLLFVWLFSISGLLLNHPKWKFTQFWPQRKQSKFEQSIQRPMETGNLAKARHLMEQLHISGEIEQMTSHPEKEQFEVQVVKPGVITNIRTDFKAQRATVEQIQTNGWGVLHMLHQFNGVRMDDPKRERDWLITGIWTFSMDALALGLIIMVLSGLYMWYQLKPKRRLGLIVLGLGVLSCSFFVFGLRWIH